MTEITGHLVRTFRPPPISISQRRPFSDPPHAVDDRFRKLLGLAAWDRLPRAVQHRFSRHLDPGELRTFAGKVIRSRHSRIGYLVARLARVVGGPLPDRPGATGPSTVTVTPDAGLGGQIWTRTYCRPGAMPQTINSVKRFSGPTGLEEYLGHGLAMRLILAVEDEALVFRSTGYDLLIGTWRVPLPHFIAPGCCTITHRDLGDGRFSFTLQLVHPWLGCLVEQVAIYEEITP